MGRNKLVMKKIEDSTSRQQTYSKRKDSIVKKANDLVILCYTDVALLIFSPNGQVTSYCSRLSVEDIMLHVVNKSDKLNRRYFDDADDWSTCSSVGVLRTSSGEYQEKLLGGEGFLQRKQNVEVDSVNTKDTSTEDCIEESPESCFSGPVCRNQQGMNVVRKQTGSQWRISFWFPIAAAGIILY
ncbi:hypothetical protein HAX54_027036 [Datura stramonium]|uniref:MADS-box domain-containing protein n=1 Tax=Datura stramonium TaxID=4076 RepID=A0ABS8V286_DATST|nr:hypothetical protein [Datura stramonium]